MSIELKNARYYLDVLEKFISNPELIMSDLSVYEVDYSFLFRNITINNKKFYAYLLEYLKSVEVFKDTFLELNPSYNVIIRIPSFQKCHIEDILTIDFENHAYWKNDCIKYYNKIMSEKYVYEPYEIQDFLKKYENYTLKKRLTNAGGSLFNKDKTCCVRISDFFFNLFVSKTYLKKILDKEYKRIEEANKCLKKKYDEDIERQELYKQKAPEQIRKIEQKQKEIIEYLSKYEFKENNY